MSILKLKNPLTINYQELKRNILGTEFPWYWTNQIDIRPGQKDVNRYDNFPVYTHSFLHKPNSEFFYSQEKDANCQLFHAVVIEILEYNNINIDIIYRMAANCVHPTEKNLYGPVHTDHDFYHKNLLVYLNNFEGGTTWCEGKTYNGKEDDIISFEGKHNFSPPLKDRRVVLVATYAQLDKNY